MTKADIVNEISKTTGIENGDCKRFFGTRRERISPRIWQLHRKDSFGEDCPQHLKEHHHHYPGTQNSRFQACKGVHGRGEVMIQL